MQSAPRILLSRIYTYIFSLHSLVPSISINNARSRAHRHSISLLIVAHIPPPSCNATGNRIIGFHIGVIVRAYRAETRIFSLLMKGHDDTPLAGSRGPVDKKLSYLPARKTKCDRAVDDPIHNTGRRRVYPPTVLSSRESIRNSK